MTVSRGDPRADDRARVGRRIRAVAVEQGMRLLREDGLEKVRLGLTSIAEVARVTLTSTARCR